MKSMQSLKRSELIEIIKEILREMHEASTTANVPGYQTPYAFSGGLAKNKKKKKDLIKRLHMKLVGKLDEASLNEQSWHKDFKGYSDKELKVISKFIMLNDKGIDGVIKMSKKKDFKPLIKKMAQKGLHESLNEKVSKSQAQTIMKQLGGRKFEMLMGVKSKGVGKDGLILHIGRNPKKVSHIIIDLDRGKDLYNVKFGKVFKYKFKIIKNLKGVGVEQLHDMIEKYTGLFTTFRPR